MLTIYDAMSHGLTVHADGAPVTASTVWFDLLDPTKDEDNHVEALLKISVPTRAEMREIEASSRFYQENGGVYMTGFNVHDAEGTTTPQSSTITFILTGETLVTVRYSDTKAFGTFKMRAERGDMPCSTGAAVMIGLIETLIERKADLIERAQDTVDRIARGVFDLTGVRNNESRLDTLLKATGTQGDTIARVQESAISLQRVLHAFHSAAVERGLDMKFLARIETAEKDINSLTENMRFLSERSGFLLNAILGMITNEQNQIIKLFSVMAVMLMPPTLVASVYGMNFRHMPELEYAQGYPMALGLMAISAIVPYLYFRRKGWL